MDLQLSKSERKRRAKDIEQLVYELSSLPEREILVLPCDREVREEIRSAKNLKGGAKKRQLKYATKLLRDTPVDELYEFLARHKGSLLKKNREFHDLEHFRNLLVDEAVRHYEDMMHNDGYINENEPSDLLRESEALKLIMDHFPDADQALLKNAALHFARTRNRKFSRELFRILRAAQEKKQFSKREGNNNGV